MTLRQHQGQTFTIIPLKNPPHGLRDRCFEQGGSGFTRTRWSSRRSNSSHWTCSPARKPMAAASGKGT